LTLSSTPDLTRVEILALLVRGEANLSLLGNRGAGTNSSTLDAAIAFAGSQVTAPLSRLVTEQLERSLNLKLRLGAELTSTGLRLTASQQIIPRLSLQGAYERSLGASAGVTSASARLLITNRLFLEGSTRSASPAASTDLSYQSSESRLELKWRLFGL
jgi:hypothetical protein